MPPERAIWLLALLPIWILVAKLGGLYDADHLAMRHLTVDEAPTIVACGVIGTCAIGLLGGLTPAGTLTLGELAAGVRGRDRAGPRRCALRREGRGAQAHRASRF